ncbi:MAG: SsrA-binding protein SmpB [Cyclobacteriaceae bacterium]|nr:SsrA-binding protein SmpB [Cyclobacteriaceae bacterium]MCK5703356.1 SsrA-binding protein SmpB [Cyclobacteriaceae bacterium]
MSKKEKNPNNINIRNKKATFEYHFIDKYVAGIVLQGSEIKSIREGKVNLQASYCVIHNREAFVKELHISPYKYASYNNHEPKRERKILLSKREIKKLAAKSQEQGLTIVPVRLFVTNRGLAKLEIALAKGKKIHDKRHDIKEKELKREIARLKK